MVDLAGDVEVFGAGRGCVLGVGLFVFAVEGESGFDVVFGAIGHAVFANGVAGSHFLILIK